MKLNHFCILTTILFSFAACKVEKVQPRPPLKIATDWAEMTLFILKNTPSNSPTFASRTLGYIGLTMYESVVNGYDGYQSMEGQLNGLTDLPIPESGVNYNWPAALNAGQAEIIRLIYVQTSDSNLMRVDALESEIYKELKGQNDKDLKESAKFGKSIAKAIFEWSKSDGGHRGYLKNFDKSLIFTSKPGSWKPPLYGQSFSRFPLHPHWGENRTFVKANQAMPLPYIIPFDTAKTSPYYKQFMEVYHKRNNLSLDEKQAAVWWGDDPDETYTPPGHSYFLATLAMKVKQPDLITCAETYAKLGMSLADAFINCWKWKYHFFSERANNYLTEHVDQQWESFWPDPPFPAFPSGHAIQAAACATVLAGMYGDTIAFDDITHVGRKPDKLRKMEFKARHFNSFWQVAQETANSRFWGGIHTHQDNDVGLEQGKIIAQHVNELKWKKS